LAQLYVSQSQENGILQFFRASKRNFLVFEMGFWISEVDGREGAHSRRSALPRPPSADTDASNTVGSSERRAVGSPGLQLRAGLRVRSPGRISLLELSKRPSMSFSLAAVASTGAARAPVPRAAARARRDGAAKLSAWTRKVRARPTHRTRHRSGARRLGARGAASRRGRRDNLLRGLPGFWWCLRRRRIAPTEPSRDLPTYPDDPASSRARISTPNAAPRTASNTRRTDPPLPVLPSADAHREPRDDE